MHVLSLLLNTKAVTIVTATHTLQEGRISEKSKFCLKSGAFNFVTENNHKNSLCNKNLGTSKGRSQWF